MRHLFSESPWRDKIGYTLVIDGAGSDSIINQALGSRRYLITVTGPGGHSWSDFGTPNPIIGLASAIEQFSRTPVSTNPKTTFNIGSISGGTSVNSIPESASMKVDLRSTSAEELARLEQALRESLEFAVHGVTRSRMRVDDLGLTYQMELIGNRPAAELAAGRAHPCRRASRGRTSRREFQTATRFDGREHPALARTRSNCDGRWRKRRGRTHGAGMVRSYRSRTRFEANSAFGSDVLGISV